MRKLTCPRCNKPHTVDAKTFDQFGPDCMCMKCVDAHHMNFMRTTGKRLGLSCVKGCRCAATVKK